MILIHNKTFDELKDELEESLKKLGINSSNGSIAKLFGNVINKFINDFYGVLTINHMMAFVTTATGEFLDSIGKLMNCERLEDEKDDDYRKRICNQVLTLTKANETAIRLTLLSYKGVADVKLKRYTNGPGSLTVIPVLDSTYREETLEPLKTIINDTVSFGEKVIIKPPKYKNVKIHISLHFSLSVSDVEKQSVAISVRDAVIKYINSLKIEESFLINELTERIMSVNDNIINYSIQHFSINNNDCLIINQGARWDEKFIVSPDKDAVIIM